MSAEGIFRGTFDVQVSDINDEMKIAAAYAPTSLIGEEELLPEYYIIRKHSIRA